MVNKLQSKINKWIYYYWSPTARDPAKIFHDQVPRKGSGTNH